MKSVDGLHDISVATFFAERKRRDEWLGLLSRAIEDDIQSEPDDTLADEDVKLGTIAGVLAVFLRDFYSDEACAAAFEIGLNYLKSAEVVEYYNGLLVAWYFDDMQSGNSEFEDSKALNAVMRRHYDAALAKLEKHYAGQDNAIRQYFQHEAGQTLNLENYLDYHMYETEIAPFEEDPESANDSHYEDISRSFEKSRREERREKHDCDNAFDSCQDGGMMEEDYEGDDVEGLPLNGPAPGSDPHDGDIFAVNEDETVLPALERYGDVEIRRHNPSEFMRKFPTFVP